MIKLDNLFVLSPEYKSWKKFQQYEINKNIFDTFEKTTPDWIMERRSGIWLFIPNIMQLPQQLMNILSIDKIPDELKEFGAATYHNRQSLWLSIPQNNLARNYLYYTALHEILDLQDSGDQSMYESEKKVIKLAKQNNENIREFLWSQLSFFRWSLDVQWSSTDKHAIQIQEVIDLLEEEIRHISNA